MIENKQLRSEPHDTLITEETVSEPGARVVETEFTLAREVLRQLCVHHSLPAAQIFVAQSQVAQSRVGLA